MSHQPREASVDAMDTGMINQLSQLGQPTNKNLTGCLQGSVVLRSYRMKQSSSFTVNNIVLQIIPGKHNSDFQRRPGGTWRQTARCADRLVPGNFLPRMLHRQFMHGGRGSDCSLWRIQRSVYGFRYQYIDIMSRNAPSDLSQIAKAFNDGKVKWK
jgi:hypothetical protein